MAVMDTNSLPIGLRVTTAGAHEIKHAEETVLACFTRHLPDWLIAD
jgi:hypothetical protein